LSKEPLEESMFVAGPISEEDFYEWEALVVGPEGTPYVSRVGSFEREIIEASRTIVGTPGS
jgi:ubiquitin-protein ligase